MKEDLFEQESFGEKIRSHTPDIIFVVAIAIVAGMVMNSRKTNAAIIPDQNKIIKQQETLKNIQNKKTVLFSDSVNIR